MVGETGSAGSGGEARSRQSEVRERGGVGGAGRSLVARELRGGSWKWWMRGRGLEGAGKGVVMWSGLLTASAEVMERVLRGLGRCFGSRKGSSSMVLSLIRDEGTRSDSRLGSVGFSSSMASNSLRRFWISCRSSR